MYLCIHIHINIHTFLHMYRYIYICGFGCICVVVRGSRVCASERGHSGSRLIGSRLPHEPPAVELIPPPARLFLFAPPAKC